MFIKTIVKTDKKSGKRYEYLRLCESYRIGSKTRHRSIISLGKLPQLDSREKKKALADRIEELLRGNNSLFVRKIDEDIEQLAQGFYKKIKEKQQQENSTTQKGVPSHLVGSKIKAAVVENPQAVPDFETIDINTFESEDVREIGCEWLCFQAIQQLGLGSFLKKEAWEDRWVKRGLIHLISKAVYPASEHKTQQWIKMNSGVAELFDVETAKINRHQLYDVSRRLYSSKDKLEGFLGVKTNELFDLADKIILYDLTNTYFEGKKQSSHLAQYGRSKEKRSDAKLLSLALVTNSEGFVKYSKIYKGNIGECSTLDKTITDLRAATTSCTSKPLIVMDAGISTEDNLKMLREKGYDYLCVTRSKLKDYQVLQGEEALTLYDKKKQPIEVKRVEKEGETDSFLYVRSTQKAKKEHSMELRVHAKYEEELDKAAQALHKKGGTKKLEKVWERIGRIKQRYTKANKHYSIKVESEKGIATKLTYKKKEVKPRNTQGVYFLRTSKTNLEKSDFWKIYNTLTEIEATFRVLKTDLSLRPVYHQKDENSEAHIFLGVMAYCIVNTIRYQLKQKGISHDWSNIVRIMNTQKVVTNTMLNKQGQKIIIRTCSRPNQEVKKIYEAMQYKQMPFYRRKFVFP